jgi:hypothetical protein
MSDAISLSQGVITTLPNLAVGLYTTKYGTEALVALTDAAAIFGPGKKLPKMTNKKLHKLFGVVDPDIDGDEDEASEQFSWAGVYPLDQLPQI